MSEFYLSADEIAVLSGLMGGDIVYGIKSELFNNWQHRHKDRIKAIMEQMIERQLFSIGFDQCVHMNHELYDALDTIVHMTSLLIIDDHYYFKKDNHIYQMNQGQHLYCIKKNDSPFVIEGESLSIDVSLSRDDLDYIEEALSSFDEDNALEYLNKKCKDSSLLMDIINEQYKKIEIKYYEWNNQEISIQQLITVGIYNQKYFEIYDSDNNIHYKGGLDYTQKYINMMFRG